MSLRSSTTLVRMQRMMKKMQGQGGGGLGDMMGGGKGPF